MAVDTTGPQKTTDADRNEWRGRDPSLAQISPTTTDETQTTETSIVHRLQHQNQQIVKETLHFYTTGGGKIEMQQSWFLSRNDFREWFWAHHVEATSVLARLHTFPEGLPEPSAEKGEKIDRAELRRLERRLGASIEPLGLTVRREGRLRWLREAYAGLREGEVIRFVPGNIIWADVRILRTDDDAPVIVDPPLLREGLVSNCRQLTACTEHPGIPFYAAQNMLWGGSKVLRGAGIGVVTHAADKMLCHVYGIQGAQLRETDELSRRKVALRKSWHVSFGVWVRSSRALFKSVSKLAIERIVFHWKSPLLAAVTPSGQLSVAEHVVATSATLEDLYTACALTSTSWLRLEHIQEWHAGTRSLGQILADGKKEDVMGSALLRFALGGLGAKIFWDKRSPGFKVHRRPHVTASQLVDTVYLVVDDADEALRIFGKSSADLRDKVAAWGAMDYSVAFVGKVKSGGKYVKHAALANGSGVLLGIVALYRPMQSSEDRSRGLELLKEHGVQIVLRCYDLAELDGLVSHGQALGILPPDFDSVLGIMRSDELANTPDLMLSQALEKRVWVLPRKSVWNERHEFRSSSVVQEDENNNNNNNNNNHEGPESFEFIPTQGMQPWYSGLVPVAPTPQSAMWLWQAPLEPLERPTDFPTKGDALLGVKEAWYEALLMELPVGRTIWALDELDPYLLQGRSAAWRTPTFLAHATLPSTAQSSASIVLEHTNLGRLAEFIVSLRQPQSS